MEVRFGEKGECEVLARKVPNGSFHPADTVIMEYKVSGCEEVKKLKSHAEGVVSFDRKTTKSAKLSGDAVAARIVVCDHAIVIKDMCASCGKDLRVKEGMAGQRVERPAAKVSMIHHVPELVVSDELAQELGNQDQQNVLASRKLVLLVDLDQTVIHTTNRPFPYDPEKHPDMSKYAMQGGEHITKLRPYTREFLLHMNKLYEMHIVTYGNRVYAHKCAEILDPDGSIFGQRVMSRDELFSARHKTKNIKALFPCGDQMVAIIDDRADVWQFSEALIQVKPYRFFKEVGDINAPKGSADQLLAEAPMDGDEDTTLHHIERVLTDVHTSFYKHYDKTGEIRDLKVVIAWLKSQVLRKCVVVLSGVIPLGVQPETSDIYRLCVQFGCTVENDVSEKTTHVIAARWGTTKVHQAHRRSVPIVSPKWLYACVERWMQADEAQFAISPESDGDARQSSREASGLSNLADMPTMGRGELQSMADEVDEALSDEDDDEEKEEEEGGDGEKEEKGEEGEGDDADGLEDEDDTPLDFSEQIEKAGGSKRLRDDDDDDDEEEDAGSGGKRGKFDDGEDEEYHRNFDDDDNDETTRDGEEDEEDDDYDDMAADIENLIG